MMEKPESEPKNGGFLGRKLSLADKRTLGRVLVTHTLALCAPFYFTWSALFVGLAVYGIGGLFGLTLCYHRLLSHKSFKVPKWLEYLFAYSGVTAIQGDPMDWVSIHRYHHQYVDTERDPHSPLIKGFWYSHFIWTSDSYSLNKRIHPDYNDEDLKNDDKNILKGSLIHGKPSNVKDMEDQLFYRLMHKTYILHPIAFAIALYAMGGFPYVVWGVGVAPTMGYQATFTINSICHTWGKRPWKTDDLSRNNWVVALFTNGEGWHNNHHAFPSSARHGLEWWQFDLTWYTIMILEAMGLATDVKVPSEKQKQYQAMALQSAQKTL